MKLFTVLSGISLFTALAATSIQAALTGWGQSKKIAQIRVQTNDAWFKVEGETTLYSWDPTTANGKNFLSVVLAAKASGQKIEWYYDNGALRCGGACYTLLGVAVLP